jgi:hypothetical protein
VPIVVPLLVDLVVCGSVAYLIASRPRVGAARSAIGAAACIVALLTPVGAVMIAAPQWVRAVAVMMMVVGFAALAEVAGTSRGHAERDATDGPGQRSGEGIPAPGASAAWERLWARFERQFAAYVESGAGRDARPRPGERAE